MPSNRELWRRTDARLCEAEARSKYARPGAPAAVVRSVPDCELTLRIAACFGVDDRTAIDEVMRLAANYRVTGNKVAAKLLEFGRRRPFWQRRRFWTTALGMVDHWLRITAMSNEPAGDGSDSPLHAAADEALDGCPTDQRPEPQPAGPLDIDESLEQASGDA